MTGSTAGSPTDTCQDWTGPAGTVTYGLASRGNAQWTSAGSASCADPYRIYCFSANRPGVIFSKSAPAARLAFVSEPTFTLDGGVQSADAICQTEGSLVLPGATFKAFLGVGGAGPAARMNLDGGTWIRSDGRPIYLRAADVANPNAVRLALLDFDESGTQVPLGPLSEIPTGVASAIDAGENCGDWTGVGTFAAGSANELLSWPNTVNRLCTSGPRRVYCFEQ